MLSVNHRCITYITIHMHTQHYIMLRISYKYKPHSEVLTLSFGQNTTTLTAQAEQVFMSLAHAHSPAGKQLKMLLIVCLVCWCRYS